MLVRRVSRYIWGGTQDGWGSGRRQRDGAGQVREPREKEIGEQKIRGEKKEKGVRNVIEETGGDR